MQVFNTDFGHCIIDTIMGSHIVKNENLCFSKVTNFRMKGNKHKKNNIVSQRNKCRVHFLFNHSLKYPIDICPTELRKFESKVPRQVKSHCCHFTAFHFLVTLASTNVLHTYIIFIKTRVHTLMCAHTYVHMRVQRCTGTRAHKHRHMKESFKKAKKFNSGVLRN